ncbi:MAG: hypothetical protein LBU02_00490 [Rickettsiales bacterium]|jgi:hypothetical protein|nr:hypothetical protein [Rickettsiales bacterium]
MYGLTIEQDKLYKQLERTIERGERIDQILQSVLKKDDLRAVFVDASKDYKTVNVGYKGYTLTLLGLVIYNSDQKSIKAILGTAIKQDILKEVLTVANITITSNGNKYTLTPLGYAIHENNQKGIEAILDAAIKQDILKEVLTSLEKDDREKIQTILQNSSILDKINQVLDSITAKDEGVPQPQAEANTEDLRTQNTAKPLVTKPGNQDSNTVHRVEDSMSADKPLVIGSVCGAIAALAVIGGCFAAGVALPILAIAGIAVAAAVLVGLVAGGITYAVSSKLEKTNAQQEQNLLGQEV